MKTQVLYASLLAPLAAVLVVSKSLAANSPHSGGRKGTDRTSLGGARLAWSQDEQGLSVQLLERRLSSEAGGLKIGEVL